MTTRAQMAAVLEKCQEEENFLREAGQKEYAREEDDAFGNFRRVGNNVKCVCEHCGQTTRIGPLAALMVYMLKHIDGLLSYVGGHKSQREDVRGRINDVRVYSALARGLIEEEEGREKAMRDMDAVAKKAHLIPLITDNLDVSRS